MMCVIFGRRAGGGKLAVYFQSQNLLQTFALWKFYCRWKELAPPVNMV